MEKAQRWFEYGALIVLIILLGAILLSQYQSPADRRGEQVFAETYYAEYGDGAPLTAEE